MTRQDGWNGPTAQAPSWLPLAVMYALTLMSLVDRLILALLVMPLRADLHISNVQLGLLFGTAFALFYAAMGLPIARIADRSHRVRLVTGAVVVWGLCTVGSGFATEFWQLLVLRAGLAVGEAALFPALHSLIHDLFDERRRPAAAAILTTAPPLGGAVAFVLGGSLVQVLSDWVAAGGGMGFRAWQLVFLVLGTLTLLLALVFALVVREPPRHARAERSDANLRGLAGSRALFLPLLIGGGICQVMPYAYQAWAPTLLTTGYGLTIAKAGSWLGGAGAIGAVAGTLLVPLVTIRLYDRGRVAALAYMPSLAILAATVLLTLAPLQPRVDILLVSYLLGNGLLLGANATVIVAMQRLAPDDLRATMIAGTLLISSSLGLGVGPVFVAWLAGAGTEAPHFGAALSTMAVLAGVLGMVVFAFTTRQVQRAAGRS